MANRHPVAEGLEEFEEFLRREKSRGKHFISVEAETLERLQSLSIELMKRAAEATGPLEGSPASAGPERHRASAAGGTEATGKSAALPDSPRPAEKYDEQSARDQLNRIFRDVKTCETCRSLGTLRDTIVFASGNPRADLMFVGEAPGAEEEKEKKPFVGPAGRKLTSIINAMGLSRDDVYISNILKYRPKKGDGRFQGSSNRKPSVTEMEASIPYIRAEIEVVAPKVIVALGGTAAEGLLERGGAVSSLRSQTHEFCEVPVVVTYHPSYVLRQERESNGERAKATKRHVWEDMLRAMDLLGMPVSEKQRGYFL